MSKQDTWKTIRPLRFEPDPTEEELHAATLPQAPPVCLKWMNLVRNIE